MDGEKDLELGSDESRVAFGLLSVAHTTKLTESSAASTFFKRKITAVKISGSRYPIHAYAADKNTCSSYELPSISVLEKSFFSLVLDSW